MTVSKIIKDHVDALLHPSVCHDSMTSARHRVFIAPRLLGSLIALASLPIYLAFRSTPSGIEAALYVWLIAPILVTYFLSRTGRYQSAHVLSSIVLATMVMVVSINTGGISSFAAVWLVVLPLEATLSASRRAISCAVFLALGCAVGLAALELMGFLPSIEPQNSMMLSFLGITSATLFAAGLAFGTELLIRTGASLLLAERERGRLLAMNMSGVVSRHCSNGAVHFISPAAEAILGVAPAHLLGHGLFDRIHVADRPAYLRAFSETARSGQGRVLEFRARRDRSPHDQGCETDFIWFEMRCRPLESSSMNFQSGQIEIVAVMRDITERKIQEQELHAARQEAERVEAAKTHFFATISHELRTPLNAIVGFSEMIARADDLMVAHERRKEYAALINESAQHLLSLVNGILDFSKMEAGTFKITPLLFRPRDVVLSCCNLMALKARENGLDLRSTAPEDLPEIVADPCAFRQITLNLLSNAIKFSERGGTVTVSVRVEAGRLALSIADTGIGIDSDDLGRLGNPFFQGNTIHQRGSEGTGLGLSIVKNLVALHGGEMIVDSKVDEGTVVTVLLPIAITSIAQHSASNVQQLPSALRAEHKDIQVKKSA